MYDKGDSVIVFYASGNPPSERQGVVIDTDNKNKFGHSLVVRLEDNRVETFRPDGSRAIGDMVIRHGRLD